MLLQHFRFSDPPGLHIRLTVVISEKVFPARARAHIRQSEPDGCYYSWITRGSLDPSKNAFKTNTFSTFSLFGPTKPEHRGQSRNFWKSASRSSEKHFFANGTNDDLCKNLLFLLLGASGCLPLASGLPNGFAKNFVKVCIICTWAPLGPPFGFLMLQNCPIFILLYFLPLHFPWFFRSVSIYPCIFLKLCSPLE